MTSEMASRRSHLRRTRAAAAQEFIPQDLPACLRWPSPGEAATVEFVVDDASTTPGMPMVDFWSHEGLPRQP